MIGEDQDQDDPTGFEQAILAFQNPEIKPNPTPITADEGTTSFFSATDVMLSVPRGVVGAAKGVYNLADLLTFDLLPDWDKNPLGESTSTVGGFVETISEFAVGFLSGSAAISAVSKAGKLGKVAKAAKWLEGPKITQQMAKGAVAGGIADFTVFEGDEMRLSNLVESIPGLNNPITEFLAAKEDDVDSLTGRLKNVIEGAVIGTAVEGVMRGVGSAYRMARGVAAAADVVKQTRLASQAGMSAEEVFRVREAAMEKNKKWLEDVPAATDEYLAQAERRFVEEDAVAQDLKASQPGADRTLQRVLLDSARKRMGGNMPREAARAVEDFIGRVGPQLFDGTTFSVKKLTGRLGEYNFFDDLIAIADKAYKGEEGQATFLHEAWHMLSRYIDDPTVRRLNKDYEKATAAFKKKTGVDPQSLNDSLQTGWPITKELQAKLENVFGAEWMSEAYRHSSLDEWFVAEMLDVTAKRTARESRRGIFGEVRNVIDAMVDSFRGNRTIDEVADKFLSGGMESKHHRNLMLTYRRSLSQRVEIPTTASSFTPTSNVDDAVKALERETFGSIDPLTPDQLKTGGVPEPRASSSKIEPATPSKPGSAPDSFNGQKLSEIRSPEGKDITSKFYTEQGSEYIQDANGRVRRIKSHHSNTGGADAGLHPWGAKAIFTKGFSQDPTKASDFNFAVAKLLERNARIAISPLESGRLSLLMWDTSAGTWRAVTNEDVFPSAVKLGYYDGKQIITAEYSNQPQMGWNVLELSFHPDGVVKSAHPGSKVSHIETSSAAIPADDAVARGVQPLLGSIGPLTPDQIKGLDPSIPRAADGSIDAQGLREALVRLRSEGKVNLVPTLQDQGADAAALQLDTYLKTGGIPEPRKTISQADQVASTEGRRAELPTENAELVRLVEDTNEVTAATVVELQTRMTTAVDDLKVKLAAGDTEGVEAARDALRLLADIYQQLGTGQGRALQLRTNGNLAQFIASTPAEAEVLGDLLDGIPYVTVVPPKTLFGRITDSMFKVAKTGLDISLELFRNSILSGPRTTSINTFGNLGGMFVNQGERAAGAWVANQILGRNRAKNMNVLATQEGRVLLGYLDQVFDVLGLMVGRTPKGGVSAATGRPIALSNAAEAWRREGMGVTLADRAWSEGIEPPRGIDAQRLGLGQATDRVDGMGRQVFEPSPAGHMVNALGKFVNLPMRLMGTVDEWFSTSIARTNARMYAIQQLGDDVLKMSADQIDAHVDGVMKNLFSESGRLYSRKAVEERAIKQAVKEGLDPSTTKGKARILSLVQNGDDAIGFAKYDAKMGHLAKQIEDRVRDATWKKDIDDLINDPLRGAGTALVGNLGKSAQALVRNVPAAGLILPFIRTPTNLIAWALNRNPASLIWKGIQSDWYRSNPARQAELMGRLTTGVALYSAGIALASMGVLTGRGPRDPAMRQQLRESGWQPYSIKVGDKYVSYARADPFSTIIGFIADLTDVAHKMEEGEIEGLTEIGASLIGATTAVITDKTFISGLTSMLNAITRPDLYGEQLVKQYASAFVPNFFAQTLTPFSDELEKSRSALDAMMMRIPGWGDESVDRLRNPLGEAVLRDKGSLGNVTDVINPFSITTAKNDPLNNEFINLGRAISSPRRTLPGGVDLWDFRNSKGQTAYDRYQELTSEVRVGNKNLRSRLMSLIQSRQYQSLASGDVEGIESPRAGVLRSEIGRYRKKAFEQLLQEFPDLRLRYMQANEVRAGMRR